MSASIVIRLMWEDCQKDRIDYGIILVKWLYGTDRLIKLDSSQMSDGIDPVSSARYTLSTITAEDVVLHCTPSVSMN